MARRGTPLPGEVRRQIKEKIENSPDRLSWRAIARACGISDRTAKKYGQRVYALSLNDRRALA